MQTLRASSRSSKQKQRYGKAKRYQPRHRGRQNKSSSSTLWKICGLSWKPGKAMPTQHHPKDTMMLRVSELECSLQALQICVEAGKAEVMEWKERTKAAMQETMVVKGELNECIRNLQAELEGWKNRGAMAAGQCLVPRKKNEYAAKQPKVLLAELLEGKRLVAEAEEGTRFVKSKTMGRKRS
ncbi:unnamed protein product [Sphagnum tenellum]